MQIDLFVLAAQIFNFLILVWLLRRFLYPRITKTMDQREKKIASQIEDAEHKKREALAQEENLRQMNKELSDQREQILSRAREEAKSLHEELSEKIRLEVEEDRARWFEAVERQKDEFLKDLRHHASKQVLAVARRALRELANEDLEQRIINAFIQRLQNTDQIERKAIREFTRNAGEILIRTSLPISASVRQRIGEMLREQTGSDVTLRFELLPDLIGGIELITPGTAITWSLANYLGDLEDEISRAIDQRTASHKIEEKALPDEK